MVDVIREIETPTKTIWEAGEFSNRLARSSALGIDFRDFPDVIQIENSGFPDVFAMLRSSVVRGQVEEGCKVRIRNGRLRMPVRAMKGEKGKIIMQPEKDVAMIGHSHLEPLPPTRRDIFNVIPKNGYEEYTPHGIFVVHKDGVVMVLRSNATLPLNESEAKTYKQERITTGEDRRRVLSTFLMKKARDHYLAVYVFRFDSREEGLIRVDNEEELMSLFSR